MYSHGKRPVCYGTKLPHAAHHACPCQEYLATCVNEAVAIADKLMLLSIIESTTDTDEERFKPSNCNFYVLRVRFCIVLLKFTPNEPPLSPSRPLPAEKNNIRRDLRGFLKARQSTLAIKVLEARMIASGEKALKRLRG